MNKLRAAVSGLRHGKQHCRAYRERPDCELVAVFDPDPKRAGECIAENSGAVAYSSFGEMLEKAKPDIVSIASPEFAHVDQAVAALKAGCHVLLEKAMADTIEGIERILEGVESTGRLLYVGQEVRLTPAFLDARRLLMDGRLGRVYQAESCYIHNCEYLCVDSQWRGNSARANHSVIGGGCHSIDLLRSLLGEVEEVFALDTHFNREITPYPDCTSVMLRFDNGAVATVVVSVATRRPYRLKLVLNGTKGFFEGDNSGGPSKVCFAPPLRHADEFQEIPTYPSSHDIANQVKNLVEAIRSGKPLVVDAWEAANSTSPCIAAVESARTGRPVKPKRFIRPVTFPQPLEALDFMDWRKLEDIGQIEER